MKFAIIITKGDMVCITKPKNAYKGDLVKIVECDNPKAIEAMLSFAQQVVNVMLIRQHQCELDMNTNKDIN